MWSNGGKCKGKGTNTRKKRREKNKIKNKEPPTTANTSDGTKASHASSLPLRRVVVLHRLVHWNLQSPLRFPSKQTLLFVSGSRFFLFWVLFVILNISSLLLFCLGVSTSLASDRLAPFCACHGQSVCPVDNNSTWESGQDKKNSSCQIGFGRRRWGGRVFCAPRRTCLESDRISMSKLYRTD